MSNDPSITVDDARRFLRGHLGGELQFDEHLRPLKVVIGRDGRMLAPVMVAMLESANTVLFLPQADDEALQMMVTLEKTPEEGEAGDLCDRWRIYHGEPEDVRWAFVHVDAAKFRGAVIDGDAIVGPNPFGAIEPKLCRDVNQSRREALSKLIAARRRLTVESPTLVGIDPYGMDVRGPFDVIRIEFEDRIDDADRAMERVDALLSSVE